MKIRLKGFCQAAKVPPSQGSSPSSVLSSKTPHPGLESSNWEKNASSSGAEIYLLVVSNPWGLLLSPGSCQASQPCFLVIIILIITLATIYYVFILCEARTSQVQSLMFCLHGICHIHILLGHNIFYLIFSFQLVHFFYMALS